MKKFLILVLIIGISLMSGCVETKNVDNSVILPINTPTPIPIKTVIPVVTMTPIPMKTAIPIATVKYQDYRRLNTGTFLIRNSAGIGELTIRNGVNYDALIVLSRPDRPKDVVISVYIRSQDSYTISNIPDGIYILYYSLGNDWNDQLKEFSIVESFSRFDEELRFETTSSSSTTYSATLYGTIEGNARTMNVDRSEFPKIG